jgi:anti-sigma28 factor (negative regulator of flagellin synthesis)
LAEASKNLTQTLKQLSSEVLTTKPAEASSQKPKKEERRKRRATDSKGAIIESMHHHGKGVYSGTFSGTLNPALQDANGQPKRDITTIVHILNDLLCAQFKSFARESRSSRHREARASQGSEKQGSNFESQDASARKVAESQLELTRSKVEELRKLIAERKARRVLRREAAARAASYSTAWSLTKECDKLHEGEGEGGQEQCQPPDFLLPSEPEPCTA